MENNDGKGDDTQILKALYSFTARGEDEYSIKRGDALVVPKSKQKASSGPSSSTDSSSESESSEPTDENWLRAKRLNSRKGGLVPKQYLQTVFGYFLYATEDHKPEQDDELEFLKGDKIEVVQKPEDTRNGLELHNGEFLLGKLLRTNEIGVFPKCKCSENLLNSQSGVTVKGYKGVNKVTNELTNKAADSETSDREPVQLDLERSTSQLKDDYNEKLKGLTDESINNNVNFDMFDDALASVARLKAELVGMSDGNLMERETTNVPSGSVSELKHSYNSKLDTLQLPVTSEQKPVVETSVDKLKQGYQQKLDDIQVPVVSMGVGDNQSSTVISVSQLKQGYNEKVEQTAKPVSSHLVNYEQEIIEELEMQDEVEDYSMSVSKLKQSYRQKIEETAKPIASNNTIDTSGNVSKIKEDYYHKLSDISDPQAEENIPANSSDHEEEQLNQKYRNTLQAKPSLHKLKGRSLVKDNPFLTGKFEHKKSTEKPKEIVPKMHQERATLEGREVLHEIAKFEGIASSCKQQEFIKKQAAVIREQEAIIEAMRDKIYRLESQLAALSEVSEV